MKFLLLIFIACATSAAPVQVAWNASPSPNVTYRVYAYTNQSDVKQFDAGTNLTTALANLTPGLWHVSATATSLDGFESGYSSEITFEIPEPPTNLRTVIIQYSGDLTNTNGWKDAGFFRLKIP